MSYAFKGDQQANNFNSGSALATGNLQSSGSNITVNVGDLLIAAFYIGGESADNGVTFTDSLGNTYIPFAHHAYDSTNVVGTYAAYCFSAFSGVVSITGTPAIAVTFRTVYGACYSGLSTYINDIATVVATPGSGANAISSGNINVTSQPAILWSFCVDQGANATPTVGTSLAFTGRPSTTARIIAEDVRITSTGNAAATWTATAGSTLDNFQVLAAAFAELAPAVTPSGGSGILSGAAPTPIGGAVLTPLVARKRESFDDRIQVPSRKIILPPWHRPSLITHLMLA